MHLTLTHSMTQYASYGAPGHCVVRGNEIINSMAVRAREMPGFAIGEN